jgi:hypothetical protein
MKPKRGPLTLRLFAILSASRAIWMTYMILLDLRALTLNGYRGPYPGIGIDNQLVVTLAAMPSKMISVFAGFSFGRPGEVAVEIVAAVTYCLVAIGIWRWSKLGRLLAIGLCGLESALLAYYLCGVVPFTFVPWPEPRLLALVSGAIFLAIYAFSFIYLLRPAIRGLFVAVAPSAVDG